MFEYVIMKYLVREIHPKDSKYTFNELSISKDRLRPLFTECFDKGDAEFYLSLREHEKETFFNEQLGFPDVLSHPASHLVYCGKQLIGFALCMEYLKDNIHISCMCVLPKYQAKGIGKLMLQYIESWCIRTGIKSITLGTEKKMKAYQLYNSFGFYITESHLIE